MSDLEKSTKENPAGRNVKNENSFAWSMMEKLFSFGTTRNLKVFQAVSTYSHFGKFP